MLIQCTKKLLNELKVKPAPPNEEKPLLSWHANLLTLGRRKTLVLMNDSSRYIVILHGIKAKDYKKLDEHIFQAIREAFRSENIMDEVIDELFAQSAGITLTTTKDRASVSRLNKACELVDFFEADLDQSELYQTALSKRTSRFLVGIGKNDYAYPHEELYRELEEMIERPIFNQEAVVLRVNLELEGHEVWRKIVVPNMTFSELHKTLQMAFGWEDSHLHEFFIFAGKPFDLKKMNREQKRHPIVHLVCTKEALNHESGVPMKMETDVKLSDYLPCDMTYIYDFGDNWTHQITVEKMIDDYDKNYPVCLDGEGEGPPEDVGGAPGYDYFLSIIKDPTHPDYEHMTSWGSGQGYEEFDREMVNRKLKGM